MQEDTLGYRIEALEHPPYPSVFFHCWFKVSKVPFLKAHSPQSKKTKGHKLPQDKGLLFHHVQAPTSNISWRSSNFLGLIHLSTSPVHRSRHRTRSRLHTQDKQYQRECVSTFKTNCSRKNVKNSKVIWLIKVHAI